MTIQEYINQSARFENISDELSVRLVQNADLAHAAFGIADEFLEWMDAMMNYIDIIRIHDLTDIASSATEKENAKTQVIKEAGDILWYIAIICRKYSLVIDSNIIIDENINSLMYPQGILSAIKKHLIYGKDINLGELQNNINAMVTILISSMNEYFNITIEDIMDRNIEKLSARYGETYTNEAAINKNETNE